MGNERLLKQIQLIVEIDKLKQILRQNEVIGTNRNEMMQSIHGTWQ